MSVLNLFAAGFEERLPAAGLRRFEDFWRLDWNWIEPRNERRDGWSGATRVCIDTDAGPLALFVKRQENHGYRTWRHPLRGRPTFYREWLSIHALREAGVPTLDPVYYGERMYQGRAQAVLVSLALDGYRDLDESFRQTDGLNDAQREATLRAVAGVLVRLHGGGFIHNCTAGKHFMLRFDDQARVDARLIDLEKVKKTRDAKRAAARDLSRLIRYTPTLLPPDHVALLLAYGDALPVGETKRLVDDVNKLLDQKRSRRGGPSYTVLVPD